MLAFKSKRGRRGVALLLLAVLVAIAWRPAARHVRAASVLLHFSSSQEPEGLARTLATPVDEADATYADAAFEGGMAVRARVYSPRGIQDPPGIVLVHGIHRLGIDEPRLVRFAKAIAGAGVRVLTPEIRALADYRVVPESIDTIGGAAHELRRRTSPGKCVGLMGTSFAGGLSLLAAADPRLSPDIDFVVSIGGDDDVARVSRFFATDEIARPDGTVLSAHAHDYGPLVLVYSHAEDFFPEADVPVARDALREWLWEEPDVARKTAEALSPSARAKMDLLFDHHVGAIAPDLLRVVDRDQASMALVSPHDRVGAVHVPVFLLHGAGDNVIPPTETLWLAHDLPHDVLREVLVTRAINHVELDGTPTIAERWGVVHVMAEILAVAEHCPTAASR